MRKSTRPLTIVSPQRIENEKVNLKKGKKLNFKLKYKCLERTKN